MDPVAKRLEVLLYSGQWWNRIGPGSSVVSCGDKGSKIPPLSLTRRRSCVEETRVVLYPTVLEMGAIIRILGLSMRASP